ncbi:tyrosine-type recombinase/integrase [Parasedimentitalea maritima]|uniref:Tyrosine-type recombinase/integrase n=1 Tax=Parasedimentitalea maritima TaxID=2578117 RepID=A0A6A4R6P5_9RHOB|nr:tyrosine-type recombinase/integrase [Zongyanglinia marina]KAE9624764.1 tyrosine-type recombinase/integrase [Zongyanglinia marina]
MLLTAAAETYPAASPTTINRQLIGPVSAVINQPAENGLAEPRKFRRLKACGGRARWLLPRLLRSAPVQLVPVLSAMIGTGCRSAEALTIDVANWRPETDEIWLPQTKNGHPRMVQIPCRARDLILGCRVPRTARLFLTPKGQGYVMRKNCDGQIQTAFNNTRDSAGLGRDVTPHVIRHTWPTWFYAATKEHGQLMDIGGWRTTSTAERYRKMAPADLGDRLAQAGWDVTRLGDQLPAPDERRMALHLVQ